MSNPGRILNKWLTIKKKFEEHKKFKEVKDGPRHKLAIRNGIKELTKFTPPQLTTKKGQEDFDSTKADVGGKLKKFCRVIKASKDGDAKAREDFLKKTKQLTVVVLALDYKTVDLSPVPESSAEPINDLDAVDVAALDRELNQPDREPTVTAPKDDRPATERFKEKLQEARNLYLQLNRSDPGRAQSVLTVINDAMAQAKKGQYETGLAGLTEVVADLANELDAGTVGPKATTTVPTESTAEWKKRIDLKKCTFGQELARGGQGAVIRLQSSDPGAPKLIGKVPLGNEMDMLGGIPLDNKDALAEMKREQDVYEKLGDHPNIVKCLGVQKVGKNDTLVLEAIDGKDASKAMTTLRAKYERGQVSQEEYWGAMQYTMAKTLEALAHMEKKGLVHHDIKPQNVMLDATTGDVKVIDMGGATKVGGQGGAFTYGFVAPDHRMGKRTVDGKADVFSVGASTFVAGEDKRFDYNKKDIKTSEDYKQAEIAYGLGDDSALQKGGGTRVNSRGERVKVSGRYEAETKYTEFVNWLMDPDPKKRPTAEEALKHPFLADSILDEDSIRNVIKETVKPKPEVPPAPQTPEDKAAGKKIDKALSTIASVEKAGRKMVTDVQAELNNVLKARSAPTGTDKEKAKLQDQLKKSRTSHTKYAGACQKWTQKNVAQANELEKLRDGLVDPVVWDAYNLKIEKALDHLRDCEETLQGYLDGLKKQLDGTGPAPTVKKSEDVIKDTEEKVAQSANLRQNFAALKEVFTKQSQAFQLVAKQPRTSPEERKAYREKRLKYMEIVGVLTGKAAGFVERFAAMLTDLEGLAETWKTTPTPSDSKQKTQAQTCIRNLVQEVAAARTTQTDLLKVKTQIASDAKAYTTDPNDPGGV